MPGGKLPPAFRQEEAFVVVEAGGKQAFRWPGRDTLDWSKTSALLADNWKELRPKRGATDSRQMEIRDAFWTDPDDLLNVV